MCELTEAKVAELANKSYISVVNALDNAIASLLSHQLVTMSSAEVGIEPTFFRS
jgi:hypothetical protein